MTIKKLRVPLSAVVVAVLVATLTWALSTRTRGSHAPEVLRLRSAAVEAAPLAAADTAGGSRSSEGGGYRLDGPLPEGTPDDAPVYPLAKPWSTERLAKVLDPDGLTTDHASWSWSSASTSTGSGSASTGVVVPAPASAPDQPVSSEDKAKAAQPEPAPEPTDPAMTEAQAREAAAPVFDAVDLRVDDARVSVTPWGASVWLDPVVHGLRTSGYTTRVELGRDRQVTYAAGFLGEPTRGDSYPLVSARAAFDRLPAPATTELCAVGPNGQGCQSPPKPEVTGAELGLLLQQTSEGDQVLVPAWLFAVKGWPDPLGQVAVSDQYLGEGDPDQSGKPSDVPATGAPTDEVPPAEGGSTEPKPAVSP